MAASPGPTASVPQLVWILTMFVPQSEPYTLNPEALKPNLQAAVSEAQAFETKELR